MQNKNNKKINNCEPLRRWFWSLIIVLVICIFSYGFCVRGAIVNIVERQGMESELAILNSRVSDLESQYIKAKNDITPELAADLGFVSISSSKFVVKNVNMPGLSLVNNSN